MAENSEKLTVLRMLYASTQLKGVCVTQQEFATFVGKHPKSLSKAFNGDEKYLTNSLLKSINTSLIEQGIIKKAITVESVREGDKEKTPEDHQDELLEAINSLTAEIAAHREAMIELTNALKSLSK